MFCEKIEDIGGILRELRLTENIIEFFKEIEQYFDEVMNAYLKKDLELAHKSWLKKEILVNKADSLVEKLDHNAFEKIKAMIQIAKHCKDMAALI